MRRFAANPYRIDMINEDRYTSRSADNVRAYAHEYVLGDGSPSSKHGVWCRQGEQVLGATVLIASGGATGVHERSMLILGSHAYVAVGDQVALRQRDRCRDLLPGRLDGTG